MHKDPTFWLSLAIAFVVGLLPGLGLAALQRSQIEQQTTLATARLRQRQAAWNAERSSLASSLASAESSVTSLAARVATLTAGITDVRMDSSPSTVAAEPAPVIVSRAIRGSERAGAPVTLVVTVRGPASRVTMRLVRVSTASPWSKTYTLARTASAAGIQTWKLTVTVPAKGRYRFGVDAYNGSAHASLPAASGQPYVLK